MLTWTEVLRRTQEGNAPPPRRVEHDDDHWRRVLAPLAYTVTRCAGTERAFSSELCHLFHPGRYACVCCGSLLFDAQQKFDSGTGWPSFTQPVDPAAIAYHADHSHGMTRVETTCSVCDAHLGHVFPDGPTPGGLRYCMNAAALQRLD